MFRMVIVTDFLDVLNAPWLANELTTIEGKLPCLRCRQLLG